MVLPSVALLALLQSVPTPKAEAYPRVQVERWACPKANECDARLFLSETEIVAFNTLYPKFDEDERPVEPGWAWMDVDPAAILTVAENRLHRREQFLFDYVASAMKDTGPPTEAQAALRLVLETQHSGAAVLLSSTTLKLIVPYTQLYDDEPPDPASLLEKVARIGLQWGQVGGIDCLLYNGPILLARYRAGYVGLADPQIDRPPKRTRRGTRNKKPR